MFFEESIKTSKNGTSQEMCREGLALDRFFPELRRVKGEAPRGWCCRVLEEQRGVDERGSSGCTPLVDAMVMGHGKCMGILQQRGAVIPLGSVEEIVSQLRSASCLHVALRGEQGFARDTANRLLRAALDNIPKKRKYVIPLLAFGARPTDEMRFFASFIRTEVHPSFTLFSTTPQVRTLQDLCKRVILERGIDRTGYPSALFKDLMGEG